VTVVRGPLEGALSLSDEEIFVSKSQNFANKNFEIFRQKLYKEIM